MRREDSAATYALEHDKPYLEEVVPGDADGLRGGGAERFCVVERRE